MYGRIAFVLSIIAVLIGLSGFVGWLAGFRLLAAFGDGWLPLSPMAALCAITLGTAVAMHAVLRDDSIGRAVLVGAALLVGVLGIISLLESIYAPHLSRFLVSLFSPLETQFEGRMSPFAGLAYIFLSGNYLLLARARVPGAVANGLAASCLLAGIMIILGYAYNSPLLYGSRFVPLSLPAALSIVSLSAAALMLLGPARAPLSFLAGDGPRQRLLRTYLPVLMGMLIIDAVLARYLPRDGSGSAGSTLSVIIFIVANLIILLVVTRGSGIALEGIERDRREAESRLEASRQMFESLFESAPGAIVAIDPAGTIVRINAEAEKLFGYRREDLLGEKVEILIPHRFAHKHVHDRNNYIAQPQVRPMGQGIALFGMRKDGSEFPIDIMLGPMETDSGRLILSVVLDITERRKAEQQIESLNAELEKRIHELSVANNELESFSYSVSHDLRAPLRAIYGYSDILAEDYAAKLDEEGNRVLSVIRQNASRMGQLIDDLLAFSRVGRAGLNISQVDMNELFASAAEEVRAAAMGRDFAIRVDPLPTVPGDRSMLKQLAVNLLANAAKFTRKRADAEIRVSVSHEDGAYTFAVADNGVGFDMQYAAKLFGVFQRLHRQQEFEGTGVGLAIVHRIATRHGGKVWAEGLLGQGATFSFSIPDSPSDMVHA
jgi:PAS domain S-box-containing protein